MQGKTEEEIEMMKQMGFGSFDTTKVRAESFMCCASTRRCTLLQMEFIASPTKVRMHVLLWC